MLAFNLMYFFVLGNYSSYSNFVPRIHPNLRSVVYCSAIAAGDVEEWEFGWFQFVGASLASEASKLMSALACTNNTQLLERCACMFCLSFSKFRKVMQRCNNEVRECKNKWKYWTKDKVVCLY